jgi:FPC/CPF motif-containing protein YcgG
MKQPPLLTRSDVEDAVEQGDLPGWAGLVLAEFNRSLMSKEQPFPCTFGVEGFTRDSFRYVFADGPREDSELLPIAHSLVHYLEIYHTIDRYTSMVVFFKPSAAPCSIDEYRANFWYVLHYLHHHDPKPWPEAIPTDSEDPNWEFCFAGEPIFVVCNTPAHIHRRSRYASGMMIAFQPRWVFEELMAHPRKSERARAIIRARLEKYDSVPPYHALGVYGDLHNREWMQYFFPDTEDNDPTREAKARCPLDTN